MNAEKISTALKARTNAAYALRFPKDGSEPSISQDELERRVARLRGLRDRVIEHGKRRASIQEARTTLWSECEKFRTAIAEGKTILSLDVECPTEGGPIQEVGLTMLKDGVLTSRNFRVHNTGIRHVPFVFGETVYGDWREVEAVLVEAAVEADYYLGHSLANDFEWLWERQGLRLPKKPFFDTAWLSNYLMRTGAIKTADPHRLLKLSQLAFLYGIDEPVVHCAGNDSRYALMTMVKIAE